MSRIHKTTFDFLRNISKNNNRQWFQDHKEAYALAHQNMISFADDLLSEMNKTDLIETPSGKKSLMRIYRDIRFSKDKTPYKIHWGGGFKRATLRLRGGYYYHIQPGDQSFIAGGFWAPNSDDLKRIRQEIAADGDRFRKVFSEPNFIQHFGSIEGEKLKTSPREYDNDHPEIELLRYKQFLVREPFSDEEVLANDFYLKATDTFRAMRPFFDMMSEVLTTDKNGVSIFD